MKSPLLGLMILVTACGGGSDAPTDARAADAAVTSGANGCANVIADFCVDFDQPAQLATPFGFAEFLGGEMTSNVVTDGNRALSLAGEGATFGQSAAFAVGTATSAVVQADLQPFETAPGKALVVGLILLDGSSSLGRQVWVVAHADHTLTVDALGISLPTTGTLDPAGVTTVQIATTWTAGATTIAMDVLAGPAGRPLVPILEDHTIELAPPPELAASIAIISLEPGLRRFVFDDVQLDLR